MFLCDGQGDVRQAILFVDRSCFSEVLILKANNVDTNQMPLSVASDLSLHCLPRFFI